MMKYLHKKHYKALSLLLIIILLMISLLDFNIVFSKTPRIHQHLQTKKVKCCYHEHDTICSHLPLIQIDTNETIPGKPTNQKDIFNKTIYSKSSSNTTSIQANFKLIDTKHYNHFNEPPTINDTIMINVRGNSSRHFPKSSYSIEFINKDYQLLGMEKHHEWVLYGPFLDKTMLRNYMFYNIAGMMMDYSPDVRFVEVMINNDYQGLYLLQESISQGEGRLPLKVNQQGKDIKGYLLKMDRASQEEINHIKDIQTFLEYNQTIQTNFTIKYPPSHELNNEIKDDIETEFQEFEYMLYSENFKNYQDYIDVDNFIDYCIINDFVMNLDAGMYSTYIYKQPQGKYKMCVWDFNNAIDNMFDEEVGFEGFIMKDRPIFNQLFKDETFVRKYIKRYKECAKKYLNKTYLMDYIEQTTSYIGLAIERNNNRWQVELQKDLLQPVNRNIKSHHQALTKMKAWIKNRCDWMDANVETLLQYCHKKG